MVSEITDAALYQKVASMRDCFIVVDDMNVNSGGQKGGKVVHELAHKLFDGKPRNVAGHSYPVQSGVAFCTNFLPPAEGPQLRRLLLNPFHGRPDGLSPPTPLQEGKLQESSRHAFLALPLMFQRVTCNLDEVSRLQERYLNHLSEVASESKTWYSWWLYFIVQYGQIVLGMPEEEAWARFQWELVRKTVMEQAVDTISSWKDCPLFVACREPVEQLKAWKPPRTALFPEPLSNKQEPVLVFRAPILDAPPLGYQARCVIKQHKGTLTEWYYSFEALPSVEAWKGAYLVFFERARENEAESAGDDDDSGFISELESELQKVCVVEVDTNEELELWMMEHSGKQFWIKADLSKCAIKGGLLSKAVGNFAKSGGSSWKVLKGSKAALRIRDAADINTGKDIVLIPVDHAEIVNKIKRKLKLP
jgi:hypothetical protein